MTNPSIEVMIEMSERIEKDMRELLKAYRLNVKTNIDEIMKYEMELLTPLTNAQSAVSAIAKIVMDVKPPDPMIELLRIALTGKCSNPNCKDCAEYGK